MPLSPDVTDFKKGQVPREVRARQLLDLAEELFLEHGYEGFSIEDLCRAADVSRPVIYQHFGSKEGVYLACQRRVREEFNVAMGEVSPAERADQVFRRVAEAYFGALDANPRRWLFVFGSTTGFVGPMAEELYGLRLETVNRIGALARALIPGLDDEAADTLAHQVSGAGEGLGRWWLHNREVPLARIVDRSIAATRAMFEAARTPA